MENVDLRMPLTVGLNLRTVAARLHRAPGARPVLRRVEECPTTVVGATGLQPLPRPVRHARGHFGEDAPECPSHAACGGLEPRPAFGEADGEAGARRRAVEDGRGAG